MSIPLAVRPSIYVLDADHGTKVGITIQTVAARLDDLRRGAGFEARLVASFEMPDAHKARQIERVAHWILRADRTHGEWFHCHPLVAVDAVREAMRGRTYLAYLRANTEEFAA